MSSAKDRDFQDFLKTPDAARSVPSRPYVFVRSPVVPEACRPASKKPVSVVKPTECRGGIPGKKRMNLHFGIQCKGT